MDSAHRLRAGMQVMTFMPLPEPAFGDRRPKAIITQAKSPVA